MTDNLPITIGADMLDASVVAQQLLKLDSQIPEKHIYPAYLEKTKVHRVILMPSLAKLCDGPNGDKGQYIKFIARAYPRCSYEIRTFTDGQVFPIMFPTNAARKMFADVMLVDYLPHIMCEDELYELHFKKVNQTTYKIMFLCRVEPEPSMEVTEWTDLKRVEAFERAQYLYKEKKYRIEKIQ